MILHVVGGDDFETEPEQPVENADFFIKRIIETDIDPIHKFEGTKTKGLLEQMASSPSQFEDLAQELSRRFSKDHVGSSRDGAFFIFELGVGRADTVIYSLLKFDYRDAMEQVNEDGQAKLRRIIHAFIADRKAVQKFALIRVVNGIAEPQVGARDRSKGSSADIGDYFANFLDVKRVMSNEELNKRAVQVGKEVLTDILPPKEAGDAVRRYKESLRDRQQINQNAIEESILGAAGLFDEGPEQDKAKKAADRRIKARKLDGIAFPPVRRVFRTHTKRRLKTTEGVELIYPDRKEDPVVKRTNREGGGEIITITTSEVTEERVLGEGGAIVTPSSLSVEQATKIFELCSREGLDCTGEDDSRGIVSQQDIHGAVAPIRLDITKPSAGEGEARYLTLEGFEVGFSSKPSYPAVVHVCCLERPFDSWQTAFIDWDDSGTKEKVSRETKSIEDLVRCYGSSDTLPKSVANWLLEKPEEFDPGASVCHRVWARNSITNLICCLGTSVNFEKGWVEFSGPPRYRAELPAIDDVFPFRAYGTELML